jgi:hypothetical protein
MKVSASTARMAVLVSGAATCLLTALANLLVERWTSFSIFSLSLWVVIPAGAVMVGMAGASGAVLACRYFNFKPAALDFVIMVAMAAATMVLIYYLGYATLVLDSGERASDVVSFQQYFDVVVTKTHMRFGRGMTDTGEVGQFGYALAAIRFAGFLIGGAAAFFWLRGMPMCEECNLYFKKIARKVVGPMSLPEAETALKALRSGDLSTYQSGLAATTSEATPKKERKAKLSVTLLNCPGCNKERVAEKIEVNNGKEWKEVKELGRSANVPAGVSLREQFS